MDTSFRHKINNAAQLGGIETSVLDNGPGRGTRIAWINTGTGLRYKVVIDRAMDIADAFYQQHSLAWLNNPAVTPPQPFAHKGIDWLRTFGGGLLTTCGLTHVGGPEADEYGERGLHGTISNIPAEIESITQPDPFTGKMDMQITGIIHQTQLFGPSLQLRRTISGTLGKASIHIHDEILNRGNTAAPHMVLYHCNFGWPLADEGTDILWQGEWQPREGAHNAFIFNEQHNFRKCPAPLNEHNGKGEAVGFIDIVADSNGISTCGLYNRQLQLAVALRFPKAQMPWLTNWQHCAEGEYVIGVEPGSHPPIGQAAARASKQLLFIEPGEKKQYDLEIEVLHTTDSINHFLRQVTAAD